MVTLGIIVVLGIAVATGLRHPMFGRKPSGARLERIKQSPNYRDGKFQNLHATPMMVAKGGKWKVFWNFLFGEKTENLKPNEDIPATKTDLHGIDRREDIVVWFGHSSIFLQTDGRRFLIDPVLTSKPPISLVMKPFRGTAIYTPDDIPDIDFLILTHDHYDHLDYPTIKQLKDKVEKVICPLGVGEYFEQWGYSPDRIVEMDWNETYRADDSLTVHCLPSRHFSGRGPSANQTLWASFLIDGKNRIFLSGDGGYDTHFAEIGRKFPNIDLALMENGQYNADWRYIHTMPHELPRAIADLSPRRVITIHNSKFALAKHAWHEPLDEVYNASQHAEWELLTPIIGEKLAYKDTTVITRKWWAEEGK